MAAELTASFILKLEDKLSGGIVALSRKLEALAALARKVQLGGLERADRALDQVGAAAARAGRRVDGIGTAARAALSELQRLSSQPILVNAGGTAYLPPGLARVAMAATIAAAAAAAGAGGGRVPALPSAPFAGPSPLLLAAPGSGGIPLAALNPALAQVQSLTGAWRGFRVELGRTAAQAQRVGQELGHAGHRALTAAATGFGIYHTVHAAAEVDSTLRQAAIAQGLSGPAATRDVARMLALVSEDAARTGQSLPGLAEAYGDLVARGLPPALVDELIKTHSTAATAYRINPVDLGQTVYSLNKTLGIGHEEMGGAIAALAQSTHAGSFKMGDYARYIPLIAGQMKGLGWTGRGALDSVASMIEIVSRQSGSAEETATNFKTMMDTLTAKYTVRSFKKVGIDLPARMAAAQKAGKNPVDAYFDILEGMIKGVKDPVQQMYILGKVLHNQTAAAAARAILQQREAQRELAEQLHQVGGDKLQRDFKTAMEGIGPQLNRLSVEWQVFEMRLGLGFARLVGPAIAALHALNAALAWMDEHMPGLSDKVLMWGGGFAVVATALGVLIPLFKAVGGGLGLLLGTVGLLGKGLRVLALGFIQLQIAGGPILWLIEAIALAGLLIWYNWDKIGPYFWRFWEDIKGSFHQFWIWLTGWIGGAMQGAIDRFKSAWDGLKGFFSGLWGGIVGTFDTLIGGIERRIAELKAALGLGGPREGDDGRRDRGAYDAPTKKLQDMPLQDQYAPISYRPGRVGFDPLEIKVSVDGNARVEAPKRIQPVDRGEMLARA